MGLFEDEDDEAIEPVNPNETRPEADDFTANTFDQYLTAEVLLPRNSKMYQGTVKQRAKDDEGRPIGKRALNPVQGGIPRREHQHLCGQSHHREPIFTG